MKMYKYLILFITILLSQVSLNGEIISEGSSIKELFYAYHQVMLITGRNDTPQFYDKKGSVIRVLEDSEMCYDKYVRNLTNDPRFRQESYALCKV